MQYVLTKNTILQMTLTKYVYSVRTKNVYCCALIMMFVQYNIHCVYHLPMFSLECSEALK